MNKFSSLTQLVNSYMSKVNTGDTQKALSFDDVRECACQTILRSAMLHKFGIVITQKSATYIEGFGYVEN
mgnify:FL=1